MLVAAKEAASALHMALYLHTLWVMEQTVIWFDRIFTVKMLLGKVSKVKTQLTLTSFVCNRYQPLLISQTISHFLLCQHLICPSEAYFQPPLLPAAQPPSPALRVPELHRSSSGGAEPVFVQKIGPVCSPLMHWQTVYTCLIGAGVCFA